MDKNEKIEEIKKWLDVHHGISGRNLDSWGYWIEYVGLINKGDTSYRILNKNGTTTDLYWAQDELIDDIYRYIDNHR